MFNTALVRGVIVSSASYTLSQSKYKATVTERSHRIVHSFNTILEGFSMIVLNDEDRLNKYQISRIHSQNIAISTIGLTVVCSRLCCYSASHKPNNPNLQNKQNCTQCNVAAGEIWYSEIKQLGWSCPSNSIKLLWMVYSLYPPDLSEMVSLVKCGVVVEMLFQKR